MIRGEHKKICKQTNQDLFPYPKHLQKMCVLVKLNANIHASIMGS